MKKSDQKEHKKVTFSFEADPGKKIFVAGTFNGWQPKKTRLKGNDTGCLEPVYSNIYFRVQIYCLTRRH